MPVCLSTHPSVVGPGSGSVPAGPPGLLGKPPVAARDARVDRAPDLVLGEAGIPAWKIGKGRRRGKDVDAVGAQDMIAARTSGERNQAARTVLGKRGATRREQLGNFGFEEQRRCTQLVDRDGATPA